MRAFSISPADIGNLWFLTKNPNIAGLSSGYGYVAGTFVLASFVVNLLIRTVTVSAAVLICHTSVPGELSLRLCMAASGKLPMIESWAPRVSQMGRAPVTFLCH